MNIERCMSEEEFKSLASGDEVTIREYNDLLDEYKDHIHLTSSGEIYGVDTPNLFFNVNMFKYCGGTYEVNYPFYEDEKITLVLPRHWVWSRYMLKPRSSAVEIPIESWEELL